MGGVDLTSMRRRNHDRRAFNNKVLIGSTEVTQDSTGVETVVTAYEATPATKGGEEITPEQGATDKIGRGVDKTVVAVVAAPKQNPRLSYRKSRSGADASENREKTKADHLKKSKSHESRKRFYQPDVNGTPSPTESRASASVHT